ncbi:hypothetical protein [Undibacterium sp.]|uniref:hypothetical protein n=1 Tax=Undibacterium sp. TaxID=1914977 RepID=UPI0037509F1F
MNDRAKPSTAREALIAEILGDLDVVLARAEALPTALKEAEQRFLASVAALDAGGDRYRMAITQFNEEAKREIQSSLERNLVKSVNDQNLAMQDAAKQAFVGESSRHINTLRQSLETISNELLELHRARKKDIIISALLSGIISSIIIFMLLKFS